MSRPKGNPSSGIVRRSRLRPWKPTPFKVRVLVALDRGPSSVQELARQLQVPQRSIWLACAQLLEHGRIRAEEGVVVARR